MLEKKFIEVYDKFKIQFFRKVFEKVRERDGSLSAMEALSLDIIRALGEPTVGQFADFLNISQSNATYKVNNLIKKGTSSARIPPPTAGSTIWCFRTSSTVTPSC